MFYPIAGGFFLAWICIQQQWGAVVAQWWLHVMDLPLLIVALLYGGCSIVLSITEQDRPSLGLVSGIFLPIIVLLGAVLFLNFGFSFNS